MRTVYKADVEAADRGLKAATMTAVDLIREGVDRQVYVGILAAAVVNAAVLRGEVEPA